MNRLEFFLNELSELTKKHGFEIGGCGCCGSPWVFDKNNDIFIAESLRYDDKKKRYEVC